MFPSLWYIALGGTSQEAAWFWLVWAGLGMDLEGLLPSSSCSFGVKFPLTIRPGKPLLVALQVGGGQWRTCLISHKQTVACLSFLSPSLPW